VKRVTSEQWVALIGQIGVGGVALLGIAWIFVKVVVPMARSSALDVVNALRDLTSEVKQLRADNTAEHNAIVAALADIGARISRLEGIYDHHERNGEPLPRRQSDPAIATGSRDMPDTGVRRR
jgi:hypothetical protein